MKFFIVVLFAFVAFSILPTITFADGEGPMNPTDVIADQTVPAVPVAAAAGAVEVGNKICPISGHKVGEMGEVVKIEHDGKLVNLCCAMCKKDFNADPAKFTKAAEDEVANDAQGAMGAADQK